MLETSLRGSCCRTYQIVYNYYLCKQSAGAGMDIMDSYLLYIFKLIKRDFVHSLRYRGGRGGGGVGRILCSLE